MPNGALGVRRLSTSCRDESGVVGLLSELRAPIGGDDLGEEGVHRVAPDVW